MSEESISTAWANWTAVIKNLIGLSFLIFVFRYITKRLDERRELCNRVGVKYYSYMKIVMNARMEAAKVTQDTEGYLCSVNTLLNRFHFEIQRIPNDGSIEDVEICEIRKLFSPKAAKCVNKIKELIGKLDGIGKESWQDVCSADVIGCADQILHEWELLVKIMAHKCWMRTSTLKREYEERANGE